MRQLCCFLPGKSHFFGVYCGRITETVEVNFLVIRVFPPIGFSNCPTRQQSYVETALFMKLFVANIERSVTENELKNVFSACGEVMSVKLVTDRATGAFKGFGFVEMPDEGQAQEAIDQLHDKVIKGRKLSVAQAKPKSIS